MKLFRAIGLVLVALALFVSCGPRGGIKTITETRVVAAPGESGAQAGGRVAPVTSAQRFGYEAAPEAPSAPGAASPPAAEPRRQSALTYSAPAPWVEKPASGMRLANFAVGAAGEAECYIIVMNGDGGGLAANINRWREQMGQDPLSEEAIAALPRTRMLESEGVLVEIVGAYSGMPGPPSPGFMMMGAVCLLGDSSVFVKMTGPEAAVRAESERFRAFCGSLRLSAEAES